MPAVTEDWRSALAAARVPPTPEQSVWDSHWRRWWLRAIANGKNPNEAVAIAYTRTEDQYGKRPNVKE
jgi:hypothetical protein